MKYVQAVLEDDEYDKFIEKANEKSISVKKAATSAIKQWIEDGGKIIIEDIKSDKHPAYESWRKYFIDDYSPKPKKILFIHPGTWGRPTHQSYIFKKIEETIENITNIKEVQFAQFSYSGIVPREFFDYWPFNTTNIDPWSFEPQEKERISEISQKNLEQFLKKHGNSYKQIIIYFPEKDFLRKAAERAAENINIKTPIIYVKVTPVDMENREKDYYECMIFPENLSNLRKSFQKIAEEIE